MSLEIDRIVYSRNTYAEHINYIRKEWTSCYH